MNANDKNELNTDSTAKGCNGNQVIPAYDRALMQYADTLKKSGNSLPELLKLTHSRSYFKKNCLENESLYRKDISVVTCRKHGMTRSLGRTNTDYDVSLEQSMADFTIKDVTCF
ncbi:hypothetical protein P3S67_004387 [Capsicum chacoense]